MDLPVYKCQRCGHKWLPRKTSSPKNCPLCKSPYWFKVKTKPSGPVRTVFAPTDELKRAMAPGKDGKALPFLTLRELAPDSLASLLKIQEEANE